jgi:hypothetical protein
MSPVEKGPKVTARSAIIVGIAGVVVAVGLFALVAIVAGGGDRDVVDVRLGDDTFDAGKVERIAREIDDRGPILYNDLVGGSRVIYVNHLADDPDEGWVAFDALQPGADDDCVLEWEPDDEVFVDPCDGTEFPRDGAGLPSYPATVEDGRVSVDLNAAFRDESTTTTIRRTGQPE